MSSLSPPKLHMSNAKHNGHTAKHGITSTCWICTKQCANWVDVITFATKPAHVKCKTHWAHRRTWYHFDMPDLHEAVRTLSRCRYFRHQTCTCQMQNTMGTPQNMVSLQHAGFARSIALNHDNSSTDNSSSDNSSSDNSSSDNCSSDNSSSDNSSSDNCSSDNSSSDNCSSDNSSSDNSSSDNSSSDNNSSSSSSSSSRPEVAAQAALAIISIHPVWFLVPSFRSTSASPIDSNQGPCRWNEESTAHTMSNKKTWDINIARNISLSWISHRAHHFESTLHRTGRLNLPTRYASTVCLQRRNNDHTMMSVLPRMFQ